MRPPSHAVGYYVGIGNKGAVGVGRYPFASEYFAAGELCSTVGDLVKWANDLASGRVVSPGTYKEMATPSPVPGEPYTAYGYGLLLGSLEGQAWVGHNGATPGFNSWLLHSWART